MSNDIYFTNAEIMKTLIREDEFKNADILRKQNEIDSVHWKK